MDQHRGDPRYRRPDAASAVEERDAENIRKDRSKGPDSASQPDASRIGGESGGGLGDRAAGGAAGQEAPPAPLDVDTAVDEEIMSRLPHTRPQRSGTRSSAGGARKRTGTRRGSSKATAARKRTTRGTSRASGKKAQAGSSTGVSEQALGIAIDVARFPLRITASVARGASGLINRIR